VIFSLARYHSVTGTRNPNSNSNSDSNSNLKGVGYSMLENLSENEVTYTEVQDRITPTLSLTTFTSF